MYIKHLSGVRYDDACDGADALGFHYDELPQVNVPLLRKTYEHVALEATKGTVAEMLEDGRRLPLDALGEYKSEEVSMWYQGAWFTPYDCGTGGCFAGWSALLYGAKPIDIDGDNDAAILVDGDVRDVSLWAAEELGLTPTESSSLFAGENKIGDITELVEKIMERAGDRL